MAGQHTYCVQWPSSGSLAPRSLSLFKTCTFQLSSLLSHFHSMIIISCAHTAFGFLLVKTETTFLENKYLSQGWSNVFLPSHHASAYLASLTEYSFPACVLWSPSPIPFLSVPPAHSWETQPPCPNGLAPASLVWALWTSRPVGCK